MMRASCASRSWSAVASVVLVLSSGCSETSSRGNYTLSAPEGWTNAPSTGVDVPGRPLQVLKGPSDAVLVVYQSLPIPSPNADALSRDLANRLINLPGLRLVVRDVKQVRGRRAAWVEVVAPGTGHALAPSGTGVPKADDRRALVPTRQVQVGIPREADTLWMRWTFPESAEKAIRPQIVDTLEDIRLSDPVVATQTY